ncbi:MAG: ABC transporter ATP-binding protein [Lachnospiraceae bacterium]|nr:ABC transporter ATP-binding protein [Lachnospiraceae bacterium]
MIELRDVKKIYGDKQNQTEALKGVSLQIEDGQMVAIMGPSGSGKSTLLNILGCMDSLTSGEYVMNGVVVSKLKDGKRQIFARDHISFVFQDFALMKDYTVYENAELPLKIKNVPKKERKRRVMEALEQVGIADLYKKFPTKISGGQQQRCAIARALASDNRYILADEPTGALDSQTGRDIVSLLKSMTKQGRTVILVTHNREIAEYADKVIELADGKCFDK